MGSPGRSMTQTCGSHLAAAVDHEEVAEDEVLLRELVAGKGPRTAS